MKLRQSLSKHTRVCTALFAVTGAVFHSQIHAQDDSDLDEDVYELSPFIIDSGDQVGYAATTTLSGTRLRTDIKDLGAQIDAMSTEFLEDIAVASADEAFLYSINIESESENPDYGDGNRARFERTGPASTARGIGNSRTTGTTLARNFFETNYQIMSYNTESLSIASGPNAILFGLGQAGGTVNGVLKRAALSDNFGSMGVRFDNNGSKQITFDYNYVILEDKLAVRAAILGSQQESWMEPSFADKKRYYGTLTWKPFEKVTLRVHHEQLDEREAPAQFRMFQDNVTPWLRENEGLWNPGDPTHKTMRNGSGRDTLIFNPDGTLAYDIVAWNGTRIGEEMRNYVNERFNAGDTASFAYIPDYNNGLDNRRWTFSPESLAMYNLPWADVNPWGETMQRTREGEITTAFLEINPFEDFYIELAYNKEEMFGRQFGYNRSFNYNISVDASALMPAGEPNPNAGKMFIQDEAWGWETPYNEEEARLTLSYELDFKEKFEEKLGDKIANFLGVHRLAYLYSDRNSDQIRSNSFRLWAQNDDGSTPSILSGGATRVDEPWQTWQRNG
ncbi:MAG: hypothetical protein MI748_10160, partial [Opitutales bacterium]|nr:hypothetical protein [Opitutales bacterium]